MAHCKLRLTAISSALLLALNSAVKADDEDLFNLSIEELLKIEVSVATGNLRTRDNTPNSISVFTSNELKRRGIKTLDQLLNYTTSIQVARSDPEAQSYGPSVRGKKSDFAGREVLVLINGLRLNEVVSGGVFAQDKQISLMNAQQVEIIRGPGSALYGANAFSAVINIITHTEVNKLTLSAGNMGATHATLSNSGSIGSLDYDLFLERYSDDGDDYEAFYNFQGQFADTDDPIDRENIQLKLKYDDLSLFYRKTQYVYHDFVSSGAQALDYQRSKTKSDSLRLTYDRKFGETEARFFIERTDSLYDGLIGLFPESPIPDPTGSPLYWSDGSLDLMIGGNIREISNQRYGMELVTQYENHTFSYGLSRLHEENDLNPFQSNIDISILEATGQLVPSTQDDFFQEGFYIGGIRFDLLNPEERDSRGIYFQDEWQVSDSWNLTLGARYDDYDDFGSNLSLRGGAIFKINESHSLKLLYGEAFRAPSFIETRAGIASGGISNPDLEPEMVETSELGWQFSGEDFFSTLTFFSNHYSDTVQYVLVDDVVPGFTALQPQNRGSKTIQGIEWELDLELTEEWIARAQFSHFFDTIEGEAVADTLAQLNLSYVKDDWSLNLSGRYTDDILSRPGDINTPQVVLKKYWLMDVSAHYQLNAAFELELSVFNFTDKEYTTYSPQAGIENGLPARGRQFFMGVNYNY